MKNAMMDGHMSSLVIPLKILTEFAWFRSLLLGRRSLRMLKNFGHITSVCHCHRQNFAFLRDVYSEIFDDSRRWNFFMTLVSSSEKSEGPRFSLIRRNLWEKEKSEAWSRRRFKLSISRGTPRSHLFLFLIFLAYMELCACPLTGNVLSLVLQKGL